MNVIWHEAVRRDCKPFLIRCSLNLRQRQLNMFRRQKMFGALKRAECEEILVHANVADAAQTFGAMGEHAGDDGKARSGDLHATDTNLVADKVDMTSHWPDFDLDPAGNLYITWSESGQGGRAAGIWYSRSTDAGRTWAAPVKVNSGTHTAIWPWLGVGDAGRVGIAWLEADRALPDSDAETSGSYGWRIVAAATTPRCSGEPPTATGSPRSAGWSRCSTEA